jgi:CO/xanthine dehydrogenase Mo-binding subunit
VARQGGLEQTLGEKPFVDDMRVPGMLHGAMVLTKHPRARVLKIQTETARAMPGVVRVFTAADVPARATGSTAPTNRFVAEGEMTAALPISPWWWPTPITRGTAAAVRSSEVLSR